MPNDLPNETREQREAMVLHQLDRRGIANEAILAVFRRTPRHLFVPFGNRDQAYEDRPLPIGAGQTISQPFIVARMTELLQLSAQPADRVLEIGTGSGYQAAILSPLVAELYSIEVVPELAERSAKLLAELGYRNVTIEAGDGYQGWAEHAPYDRIILTAAPPRIPQALVDQLAPEGRLVAPEGAGDNQTLIVLDKNQSGEVTRRTDVPVRFVPMVSSDPFAG